MDQALQQFHMPVHNAAKLARSIDHFRAAGLVPVYPSSRRFGEDFGYLMTFLIPLVHVSNRARIWGKTIIFEGLQQHFLFLEIYRFEIFIDEVAGKDEESRPGGSALACRS